jgi:hypothetical protein
MTAPLARVSFASTLDDCVDVSWRVTNHLKSIRSMRLRDGFVAGTGAAIVLLWLTWRIQSEMPPAAIAFVAILAFVVFFVSWQQHSRSHHSRVTRRILLETRGEDPCQCDVELHGDRILVQQGENTVALPWSHVDSISDDRGDLEILGKGTALVVRARAFANEGDRDAFLQLAIELAARARPGA